MSITNYLEKNKTAAGFIVGSKADCVEIVGSEIFDDLFRRAAAKMAAEMMPDASFKERKELEKLIRFEQSEFICHFVCCELHKKFLEINLINFK